MSNPTGEHRRAADQPDATMWDRNKRRVAGAWKLALNATRDVILILLAILFAIVSVHGSFVHDSALTLTDNLESFLSACCVLGERGLKLYREKGGHADT